MKNCSYWEEKLQDWVFEDSFEEKEELLHHLETCSDCQKKVESLQALKQSLTSLDTVEPPSELHENIMKKVKIQAPVSTVKEEKRKKRFSFVPSRSIGYGARDYVKMFGQAAASFAIFFLVFSGLLVLIGPKTMKEVPDVYESPSRNVANDDAAPVSGAKNMVEKENGVLEGVMEEVADVAAKEEEDIENKSKYIESQSLDDYYNAWDTYPFTSISSIYSYAIYVDVANVDDVLAKIMTYGDLINLSKMGYNREAKRFTSLSLDLYARYENSDDILKYLLDVSVKDNYTVNQSAKNVSSDVIRMRQEIKSKETQYNRLLEQSNTVESLEGFIFLENKMDEISREIDNNKTMLNTLSQQVDHATFEIFVSEPVEDMIMPVLSDAPLGIRMKNAFIKSWNLLVYFAEIILLFVASYAVPIVFVGVIAGVVFFFVMARRKKRKS